jgi:hypothetical protein
MDWSRPPTARSLAGRNREAPFPLGRYFEWLNGPAGFRVGVAWLLVANAGRDASAQADLVGGVFGLRRGEFATGFGRELLDQPLA